MADLITPMRMGDAIPEWLLVAEPMEANAPRGNFRFALDVHVMEGPDYFVIVPMQLGAYAQLLDTSGTTKHRVYAPTKPVHAIIQQEVFFPLEVNAWHGGSGAAEPQVAGNLIAPPGVEVPRPQADVYLQSARPAPMTFLQRLRWLFRGF